MTTRRLKADERRKQILRCAIRVFARETYYGATTKKIAEEAGITEALIYRHFGSKRALFLEGITLTASRLFTGVESIFRRDRDQPLEAIRNAVQYYVDSLERHEDLAKMIFLVLAELDESDVREAYLPYQVAGLKLVADTMRHWHRKGYLIDGVETDPRSAAWLYYGTYLVLALVKQSHTDLQIDPEYALSLARPFFRPECQ